MTRHLSWLLAALLVVALPVSALAATGDAGVSIERVDISGYPDVRITVSAPEGEGSIPAGAFTLTEAGENRDLAVTKVRTADLEIVLLLDGTGSMGGAPVAAAKTAATSFVRQLPTDTRTAVLAYDTGSTVLSPASTDVDAHVAGIAQLQADGRTAMYDALADALDQFSDRAEAKQALILLTDGEDNASAASLDAVTEQLAASGVTLYAVEFMTDYTDSAALQQLVGATDGTISTADDSQALNVVYRDLAAQLVSQYDLEFRSSAAGTTPLVVRVDHAGFAGEARRDVELPEAAPAVAPQPDADAPPVLDVLSINTDNHPEVVVRVLAPRQLRGSELDAGAFTLLEGGLARNVQVSQVTQLGLDVVLSIDTSGSMSGESLEQAKAAAVQFVETMPATTRVAVQSFNQEPTLVQGFTDDATAAIAAIDSLEAAGNTSLYDAAVAAAGLFDMDREAVRSVVLLSDGADTTSTATLTEAAERLAATGGAIHAVELRNGSTDPEALAQLVEPSRGEVLAADDPPALAGLYAEMAADLANQYLLTYTSIGFGTTELKVGVDAQGVQAEAVETVDLPPISPVQAFLAGRGALLLGAALSYVAMALIILILLAPPTPRARLTTAAVPAGAGAARTGSSVLSGVAEWATAAADRRLDRHGRRQSINALLEQAGVNLRAGEFVVLALCAAIGAGGLGFVLSGFLLGLLLSAVAALAAFLTLRLLADRRRARFADQLSDTLQLLAGSLRAGYSILQAVDAVAREADSPTAEEFRRLVVETRLGRDLGGALHAMGERAGNQDFSWVVQAIAIHREVGGDLADVLDTVAETIRERNQIRRQVQALSAEGRLSAWVLLALPFGVGGFIWLTNREYLAVLTEHLAGWVMLGAGAVLITAGALWLRRIVRVEF